MSSSEVVTFNGIKFRRYPESENWAERSYFVPAGNHRKRGVGRLHQEIWKKEHGPIPDGYHVHHADHDPLNNDPSNLVLEEGDDHRSYHARQPDRVAASRKNIEIARKSAAIWHGSDAGRAWHVEHGKQTWEGREPKSYVCEYCGKPYESLKPTGNRFCSNNCRTQARRVSGVDNVARSCVICGAGFEANKYGKASTCSRPCRSKLAHTVRL